MKRCAIAVTMLATAGAASAEESGYVGEGDPWVVAVGPTLRRRATLAGDEVTTLGAGLQIGRAWGTILELRAGLEASARGAGAMTVIAGVVLMPISIDRLSLGIEAEVGAFSRWRAAGTGTLTRVGPMIAWRPFAEHEQPICHGCPQRNHHVPLQLELVPLAIDVVREDTTSVRLGATVRIARRF
jgi:hypothetical protein